MASIIKLKRSSTQSAVPGSLEAGEIAVNLFDRKLYAGNGTGVTAVGGGEVFKLTVDEPTTAGSGAYIKLLGETVPSTNSVLLQAGTDLDITKQANGSILFALEQTISSNTTGTAATADALTTARTIQISGDVAGSASFDGSGNINISSTIQADSVALGTDTTGNYIATIAGTANEVEVSGSGSESAAVTIGLPNDVTIGNDLTVTGAATVGGNLQVDGNLNVEGAVTYISSSTVNVDDSMLKLSANNAADTVDTGVYGKYVVSGNSAVQYAGYFRDATDGAFKFYTGLDVEPTTTVNTSDTGYGLAQLDAVIDGGTY